MRYLKDNRLCPADSTRPPPSPTSRYMAAPRRSGLRGRRRSRALSDRTAGRPGAYTVEVELRYQAIGYRWAHNLQPYDAPEPKAFLEYFQAMSPSASSLVQRAVAEGRR